MIRETYVALERHIITQGNEDNTPKEIVETALEVCRLECEAKLAEHRNKYTISKSATDSGNESPQHGSHETEVILHEGAIQRGLARPAGDSESNSACGQNQGTQEDDLDMIVDAYSGDNENAGSVTDSILGMYV